MKNEERMNFECEHCGTLFDRHLFDIPKSLERVDYLGPIPSVEVERTCHTRIQRLHSSSTQPFRLSQIISVSISRRNALLFASGNSSARFYSASSRMHRSPAVIEHRRVIH